MGWQHIDSGQVGESSLELYRQPNEFMIRVNGFELMNSLWHRSEKALADIGASVVQTAHPRILIGGLGLGYTLSAFLEQYGDQAEIIVAEKSPDVLRWYRSFFKRKVLGNLRDDTVVFREIDVAECIQEGGPYDLIVLDIDNGPEAICGHLNSQLYTRAGLEAIRGRLNSKSSLLLWSAFESPEFEDNALAAGFVVKVLPIEVGHRDHLHYVYACQC